MEAAYAALYIPGGPRIVFYVAAGIVNSVLYLLLVVLLRKWEWGDDRRFLFLIIAAGVLFRLTVLPSAPVGSDDLYRYIWDGKVQHAGIDPYRYAPSSDSLLAFHSAMLPSRVTFPDMKTIYPPLSEWYFAAVFACAGESVLGFKIAAAIVDAVTVLLLIVVLRKFRMPLRYAALYCWSPLSVLQFALDGHCDVLMFPFVLAGVLCAVRGRDLIGAGLLGIAAAAKLFPLILLPALFRRHNWRRRALLILTAAAVPAAAYLPSLVSGSSPFESVRIYSLNWAANGFLFELCYAVVRNNQTAHVIMSLVWIGWALFVLRRGGEIIDMMCALLFGFFLCSATVYPWYVAMLVLLLPFRPRWDILSLAVLVNLGTIPWIRYVTAGEWRNPLWLMAIEYLPVFAAAWLYYRPPGGRLLPPMLTPDRPQSAATA